MAGLNKSEFDSLVGLLARAHYHGDTAMLEQHVTKAYDGLVKESGVPVADLPPVPGAMTDGSKRRLTADSVLDEFDNFEFVEDPEEILAHKLELEAIRDEIESANSGCSSTGNWTVWCSNCCSEPWWHPRFRALAQGCAVR